MIAHGSASTECTDIGTEVFFTCNKEFVILGYEEIECLPSGKWSGDTPFCIRKLKECGIGIAINLSYFQSYNCGTAYCVAAKGSWVDVTASKFSVRSTFQLEIRLTFVIDLPQLSTLHTLPVLYSDSLLTSSW